MKGASFGSADERSVAISRRLSRLANHGALMIVALILLDTWGRWEQFGVVLGVQVLLVPFNIWVTRRALPQLGVKRAELIRAVVNLSCTPLILHFADHSSAVWLWLPYVAMTYDHLDRRAAWALLASMAVVMNVMTFVDGLSLMYPLSMTALAVFCAQASFVRVHVISDMLAESEQHRAALSQAHDEIQRSHAQLKRETAARSASEAAARDMARQAGRAEMAAGVLHNIGNALNGFTVLSGLLDQAARASRASRLGDTVSLLRELDEKHGGALRHDDKGKQVLAYLEKLAEQWRAENAAVLEHTRDLQTSAQHIASVIAKQQDYAKPCTVSEVCHPSELVHDAVVLTSSSVGRRTIDIKERYGCTEAVTLDRHRVLQIVMNLLRNAEDAVTAETVPNPGIEVATSYEAGWLKVTVSDNGVGISETTLTKLFQYGYTTKEKGHGFGLHNSRLLASEVGGRLTCSSRGAGQGSTFTLELPAASPS